MQIFDTRLPNAFWQRVIPEPNSGCWLWIGSITQHGYGQVWTSKTKRVAAHRVSYVAARGAVASGLDLDHLCRVRCCCNPQHLEAVTRRVNLLRGETLAASNAKKTHCDRGHELSPDNVWHGRSRQCKTCYYALRSSRKAVAL